MHTLITYPEYALLKTNAPPSGTPQVVDETAPVRNEPKRKIVCRKCGFKVADTSAATRVNGSHEHSFFNPHGYVFEIRCFSAAPGCMPYGPPSSEFTWFAGHTWQIAACSLCSAHLGWKFQSGPATFYGLIKGNIMEQEK